MRRRADRNALPRPVGMPVSQRVIPPIEDATGYAPAASVHMRVLVVDDDDIARELLTSTLKQAGHTVFELSSALGAPRAVFEHAVEAVVLDVTLPGFGGDKLTRVLRQNSHGRSLAIVLTSSRPVDELHALAIAVDADAAVPKGEIRARLDLALTHAVRCRERVSGPR
jgi:CheY-like chemotaxis protein